VRNAPSAARRPTWDWPRQLFASTETSWRSSSASRPRATRGGLPDRRERPGRDRSER
jgi:hypothetical protein